MRRDRSMRRGEMWLRRGELVGPLEDAVFAARLDEVVGPFTHGQGWMVARLLSVTPRSRQPFGETRASIETELLRSARIRAFEEWVASRRAAVAVIEPAFEHPGHPMHGLPRHRH